MVLKDKVDFQEGGKKFFLRLLFFISLLSLFRFHHFAVSYRFWRLARFQFVLLFPFKAYPAGFNDPTRSNNQQQTPVNPYDAWTAFLAFQQQQLQYQQQHQQQQHRRYTRGAHTEAELIAFAEDIAEAKAMKKEALTNLTCVLADQGVLDANLQVNLRHFTHDMWKSLAEPVDFDLQRRISEKAEDCYAISNALPQHILDRKPLARRFGRQMLFMKCMVVSIKSTFSPSYFLRHCDKGGKSFSIFELLFFLPLCVFLSRFFFVGGGKNSFLE